MLSLNDHLLSEELDTLDIAPTDNATVSHCNIALLCNNFTLQKSEYWSNGLTINQKLWQFPKALLSHEAWLYHSTVWLDCEPSYHSVHV